MCSAAEGGPLYSDSMVPPPARYTTRPRRCGLPAPAHPHERTRLREDAWAFRDFLEQIKVRAGGFQQDAILHLVHPEVL